MNISLSLICYCYSSWLEQTITRVIISSVDFIVSKYYIHCNSIIFFRLFLFFNTNKVIVIILFECSGCILDDIYVHNAGGGSIGWFNNTFVFARFNANGNESFFLTDFHHPIYKTAFRYGINSIGIDRLLHHRLHP